MEVLCGCNEGWEYEESTLGGVNLIGGRRRVRCTRPGCHGGWVTVPDSVKIVQHRKDDRW
jgi:hypothetical protein